MSHILPELEDILADAVLEAEHKSTDDAVNIVLSALRVALELGSIDSAVRASSTD